MCIFYLHQKTVDNFQKKISYRNRIFLQKNSIYCPKIPIRSISIFSQIYILWPFRFITCKMSKTRSATKTCQLLFTYYTMYHKNRQSQRYHAVSLLLMISYCYTKSKFFFLRIVSKSFPGK